VHTTNLPIARQKAAGYGQAVINLLHDLLFGLGAKRQARLFFVIFSDILVIA